MSSNVKTKIYKTVYLPTLLYGSETWVMLRKHKSRVAFSELKYLNRLEGKARKDRIRNTTIIESLKMSSIVEEIEKRNFKWYGHLIRTNNQRKVEYIF